MIKCRFGSLFCRLVFFNGCGRSPKHFHAHKQLARFSLPLTAAPSQCLPCCFEISASAPFTTPFWGGCLSGTRRTTLKSLPYWGSAFLFVYRVPQNSRLLPDFHETIELPQAADSLGRRECEVGWSNTLLCVLRNAHWKLFQRYSRSSTQLSAKMETASLFL